MKSTLGMLALAALLLTACQDAPNEDKDSASRKGEALAVKAKNKVGAEEGPKVDQLWSKKVSAITQPIVADGVAVLVTRTPRERLEISGYEAASGDRLWRRPFSQGDVTVPRSLFGHAAESSDGKGYAVYIPDPGNRPATTGPLRITAVDVHTGKVVRRSPPVDPGFPIGICDDGKDACFDTSGSAAHFMGREYAIPEGEYRWSLDSWRISKEPGLPKGTSPIATGGFYNTGRFGDDRPNVGRYVNGKKLWERPLLGILGKQYGEYLAQHVVWPKYAEPASQYAFTAGSGVAEPRKRGQLLVSKVGGTETISVDERTGETLWRDQSDIGCFNGGLEPIELVGEVRLRCRMAGKVLYRPGASVVTRGEGFRVDVEGYDVRTGETVWSEQIGARAAMHWWEQVRVLKSRSTVTLDTVDGPKTVRIGDGTAVGPDDRFWCEGRFPRYWQDDPWAGRVRRPGGLRLFVCSMDAKPASGVPEATSFTDEFEPAEDGVYVVATARGVTAYAVR